MIDVLLAVRKDAADELKDFAGDGHDPVHLRNLATEAIIDYVRRRTPWYRRLWKRRTAQRTVK